MYWPKFTYAKYTGTKCTGTKWTGAKCTSTKCTGKKFTVTKCTGQNLMAQNKLVRNVLHNMCWYILYIQNKMNLLCNMHWSRAMHNYSSSLRQHKKMKLSENELHYVVWRTISSSNSTSKNKTCQKIRLIFKFEVKK